VIRFDQITRNRDLSDKLVGLYGNVQALDLWIAGLAEDHLPGSSVGPTFQAIIARQFERVRDGDINWYERNFSGPQLAALQATRLSDIIRRNTTITKLQDNVFFYNPDTTLASLTAKTGTLPPTLISGPPTPLVSLAFDGTGNNLLHYTWGSAGANLLRFAPAAYSDGISTPAGATRPGARAISNSVSVLTATEPNTRLMSSWVYGWGQFIDHDLGLTTTGTISFPIPVPLGDPSFDPFNTGTAVISMSRSTYDPTTGTAAASVTEVVQRIVYQPAPAPHPHQVISVSLPTPRALPTK